MPTATATQAFEAALTLHRSGRHGEARQAYRDLLDRVPDHAECLNNLGALEIAAGHSAAALAFLFRALRARPRFGECYHNVGLAMLALGRPGEAIGYLHNAILFSGRAEVHADLARALGAIGKSSEAVAAARQSLALDADNKSALSVLAHQCFALQDDQTAGAAFEALAERHGGGSEMWFNAVKSWRRGRDWPRAEAALERAADSGAEPALLARNRATMAHDRGRLNEALAFAGQAVELDPDTPGSFEARGLALHDLGRLDEAINDYDTVLARWPDRTRAEVFKALSLLLKGDWEEGLESFEARWYADFPPPMHQHHGFPHIPHWDGGPLDGKRFLLIAEQGYGDAIQFVRYAKELAEAGALVTLYCKPRLMPLFRALPFIDALIEQDTVTMPEADLQAPLLSLPRIMGRYPPDVPSASGYIVAPKTTWSRGRSRKPVVGLVWRGNPQNAKDWKRSHDLKDLEPLLQVPGIRWVSLQLAEENREIEATAWAGKIEDVSDHMPGWCETAGVIGELALVITVDTAQAHMAGALGKPTWLMLSRVPDWRWGLSGTTTPWYESLRLYRQPDRESWQPVISQLATDLADWAADFTRTGKQ
jgi:tetratricopeptide (TPR) repeat protein